VLFAAAVTYFFLLFINFSYFSIPIHSLAAGHHSIQVGFISLDMVLAHFLQIISDSSDHISETVSHQKQVISSGYGVRISRLPGQLSLNDIPNYYCITALRVRVTTDLLGSFEKTWILFETCPSLPFVSIFAVIFPVSPGLI
jgi:hypothetical protein